MTEMAKNYGFQHRKSTANHPQTNGLVEATNKIIRGAIRKMMPEKDEWDTIVPQVVQIINGTANRATGMSPFEILHGTKMRLMHHVAQDLNLADDINDISQAEIEETVNKIALHSRLSALPALVDQRAAAREAIQIEQGSYKYDYDKKRKVFHFEVDDMVRISNPNKKRKGYKDEQNYGAPHRITSIIDGNAYLEGFKNRSFSVNNLRHFPPKPPILKTEAKFMREAPPAKRRNFAYTRNLRPDDDFSEPKIVYSNVDQDFEQYGNIIEKPRDVEIVITTSLYRLSKSSVDRLQIEKTFVDDAVVDASLTLFPAINPYLFDSQVCSGNSI
jgi:hypothetical protein